MRGVVLRGLRSPRARSAPGRPAAAPAPGPPPTAPSAGRWAGPASAGTPPGRASSSPRLAELVSLPDSRVGVRVPLGLARLRTGPARRSPREWCSCPGPGSRRCRPGSGSRPRRPPGVPGRRSRPARRARCLRRPAPRQSPGRPAGRRTRGTTRRARSGGGLWPACRTRCPACSPGGRRPGSPASARPRRSGCLAGPGSGPRGPAWLPSASVTSASGLTWPSSISRSRTSAASRGRGGVRRGHQQGLAAAEVAVQPERQRLIEYPVLRAVVDPSPSGRTRPARRRRPRAGAARPPAPRRG